MATRQITQKETIIAALLLCLWWGGKTLKTYNGQFQLGTIVSSDL